MSFAIAAAGTGGHVFPGLAVGEALVERGADPAEVLFVGGDRLEATVFPEAGFPFLGLELAGLERSLTLRNLRIPAVVWQAVGALATVYRERGIAAVLGLGGYVTVPAGLAARRVGIPMCVSEQNAGAGLANRFVSRFAARSFGSFPVTHGLPGAEWVGNPIRRALSSFNRPALRPGALARWGLDSQTPIVGVFGGSLGAGVINEAVVDLMSSWAGPPIQVLHIAGRGRDMVQAYAATAGRRWIVEEFVDDMADFFAASDLVVARSGGSVAELTATGTPSILVPGGFGSGGHQLANARALEKEGAAEVVLEDRLADLPTTLARLVGDESTLETMRRNCQQLARPEAASDIAAALDLEAGR